MLNYLSILHSEVRPALGCTEPIAVAYAAAKARQVLGRQPEHIDVSVSGNVLKNGMGVGIPGSEDVGLEIAAALGVFGGDAQAVLEVLSGITPGQARQARAFAAQGGVHVAVAQTSQRLYIRVCCRAGEEYGEVTIAGTHTNIVSIVHNGETQYEAAAAQEQQENGAAGMTVADIYAFVTTVPACDLEFLQTGIDMNEAVAREGLTHEYGLCVGKSIWENSQRDENHLDMDSSAMSWAAAGADARMAGCSLPVMTTAGSGNHGLTATLPVTTVGRYLGSGREQVLRAVALSDLVTVHVKEKIGKLSALCGCGIGASIGACCGILYLRGAGLDIMAAAIQNMVADISGIICDGGKAGCALKIATAVSSACRCARLAENHHSADGMNGIVSDDIEQTLNNLGRLVKQGMGVTDDVVLDIMVSKNAC